jgi:c-di-GMP-binding flagellar brake protein YcgR
MTPEQYSQVKHPGEENFSLSGGFIGPDSRNGEAGTKLGADPSLVSFLLHLDQKLDQILSILNRDRDEKCLTGQGLGVNISGSGMNVIVDKPVENGQILHTKFLLSKYPLVFMDVYGEVVRVIPMSEGDETTYHLGVQFMDLNVGDRERIISSVFQKQREEIRKSRI